jgi:arsenate reductase (thioredoxin)
MSPHRRILFVCLHGAAKSVLAAVDCESLAAARGLDIRADFAGTEPDADIAPAVAAALRAEGMDLGGKKPRLVTSEDVVAADQVVAFGCDLGSAAAPGARIEQWADVPAVSDGLPAARSAIRAHLERLIDGWARR